MSLDCIRIFVGSETGQGAAEAALAQSIRRNVSGPVAITWMREGAGEAWSGWSRDGWYTGFTCFRYAIPFVARQGRAIYMDVDMIALRDLRELWEMELHRPIAALTPRRADVMLIDCDALAARAVAGWPSTLEEMKRSGRPIEHYRRMLEAADCFQPLDGRWNVIDGANGESLDDIAILHFSDMSTQPWRPFPDRFDYRPHPRPDLEAVWREYAAAAEAVA